MVLWYVGFLFNFCYFAWSPSIFNSSCWTSFEHKNISGLKLWLPVRKGTGSAVFEKSWATWIVQLWTKTVLIYTGSILTSLAKIWNGWREKTKAQLNRNTAK